MPLPDRLRALYQQGAGRKEIFDLLATYRNRVSETSAERCSQLTGVPYDQTVLLFKELGELDVGSFKLGRRGAKTRIEWRYGPGAVGQVAQGKAKQLEPYQPTDESPSPLPVAAEAVNQGPSPSQMVGHSFGQIIDLARRNLADQLGLAPEKIEITIKP